MFPNGRKRDLYWGLRPPTVVPKQSGCVCVRVSMHWVEVTKDDQRTSLRSAGCTKPEALKGMI